MRNVIQRLGEFGVIPVVSIETGGQAPALGQALMNGGLPCAEITFRTAAAADAISALVQEFPEMLVGAGTVLSIDQAQQAVDAGAHFIVSPGFDAQIADWCNERVMPVIPGVATPSEIMMAMRMELTVLKFFPAEAIGGLAVLKAVGGPFKTVKFVPTGGVTAANLASYLTHPTVHACGGSWLVARQLISDGDFEEVTRRTREAVNIVQRVRAAEV